MPQIINTNVSSMTTQRLLNKSQGDFNKSLERLSSGLRINSAKDDAAGLAISEKMTSQVRGLSVAIRNANDAISTTQIAEGGLGQTADILQRMRELAVQASNGSYSSSELDNLNQEFSELSTEIGRIATDTKINGVTLLDGTFTAQFQVGADAGQTISLAITTDFRASSLGVGTAINITAFSNAQTAIDKLSSVLDTVNSQRAKFGASQSRFESVISLNEIAKENQSAARSRIRDADFAAETASLTRAQILQQAGISMLAQANSSPQNVLSLLG